MASYSYRTNPVPDMMHATLLSWAWTHLPEPEDADILGEFIFVNGLVVAKAVVNHRGYIYNIGVVDERSNAK